MEAAAAVAELGGVADARRIMAQRIAAATSIAATGASTMALMRLHVRRRHDVLRREHERVPRCPVILGIVVERGQLVVRTLRHEALIREQTFCRFVVDAAA